MDVRIEGTIYSIGETAEYGKNGFRKRPVVIEIAGNWPQFFEVDLTQDDTDLDLPPVGEPWGCIARVRGRKWDGPQGEKFFTSLEYVAQLEPGSARTTKPAITEEVPF